MYLLSPQFYLCRNLWSVLLAFTFMASACTAWAKDHITERAYWADPSGQVSFDQARNQSYIPYDGVLSKGYNHSVQWVRLTIGPAAPGIDALVLRIRPVYLDQISLFDPSEPSTLSSPKPAGDRVAWQAGAFESLNHNFIIPASPQPRQIWLRLQTTSTQMLHVEALTPIEMMHHEHLLWLLYSAFLALIMSFIIWVLLAWLQGRDGVNGFFVVRQTVLFVYTASFFGYHRMLLGGVLSPEALDTGYNWLVLLTTGLSFGFEKKFLSEYALPRWGHWILNGLLCSSAAAMILLLLGLTKQALHTNMLLNAMGSLSLLVVSSGLSLQAPTSSTAPHYLLPRAVLLGYYSVVIAVLVFTVLPSLGLMSGTTMALYGVLLYGAVSGLLMTALLQFRSRQTERLRKEMANSLFLSRQQVAIETRRREDQSQLLHMLMHELKTPLSVIDMALAARPEADKSAGYVSRAIVNMKNILDRCLHADRIAEGKLLIHKVVLNLAELLNDVVADRKDRTLRIQLRMKVPDAQVLTDMACVQIIVNNLLDNALKYGDLTSPVMLELLPSVHEGHPGLCISVANKPDLAGWPDADKVFTKYYRSAGAQRQSGTGLGLFLSASLARQLGAQCRYRPDETWIRFELWLPY